MTTFDLWPGDAPGKAHGDAPRIYYYPTSEKKGRGAVVIFPGGGYIKRATPEDKGGFSKAINDLGLDCFIVGYRVNEDASPDLFPAPMLDARRAMRFVRTNAERFGIDSSKIAAMGSSAGGHLTAFTSTYRGALKGETQDEIDAVDYMPNLQILCYPVTSCASHRPSYINLLGESAEAIADGYDPILLADDKTPPAFIWHTAEDPGVSVLGSYNYAARLKELGIPVEMHIFPFGAHGLGTGKVGHRGLEPHITIWTELLRRWLELFGFYS